MNSTFSKTSSYWVRYSGYQFKVVNGIEYIIPAPDAKLSLYDPLKDAEALILKALNVGLLCMKRASYAKIRKAIMSFINNYGLLGFMTALPTTPDFMEYSAVYLPKNHFIREESMAVDEYISLFFPFDKPVFHKDKDAIRWDVQGQDMVALAMTMSEQPLAMNMSLQQNYAERFDWLVTQFKDLAFPLCSSFYYFQDYGDIDDTMRELYRKGTSAFGGNVPTYHISLQDGPTIVWDFHSLLLGIQMMFSFMLTDKEQPLQLCKQCARAFIAKKSDEGFYCERCRGKHERP